MPGYPRKKITSSKRNMRTRKQTLTYTGRCTIPQAWRWQLFSFRGNKKAMSHLDPENDPSIHRLEGSSGNEKGGLIIMKKGPSSADDKHVFKVWGNMFGCEYGVFLPKISFSFRASAIAIALHIFSSKCKSFGIVSVPVENWWFVMDGIPFIQECVKALHNLCTLWNTL